MKMFPLRGLRVRQKPLCPSSGSRRILTKAAAGKSRGHRWKRHGVKWLQSSAAENSVFSTTTEQPRFRLHGQKVFVLLSSYGSASTLAQLLCLGPQILLLLLLTGPLSSSSSSSLLVIIPGKQLAEKQSGICTMTSLLLKVSFCQSDKSYILFVLK